MTDKIEPLCYERIEKELDDKLFKVIETEENEVLREWNKITVRILCDVAEKMRNMVLSDGEK